MTEPPRESNETVAADALREIPEKAAHGLRMAEVSRRALLDVAALPHLPGVDTALLNPLASLPPHVTVAAATRSFPPAVHKVDKSGVKD